ncbi:hypothetical protein [Paenibacillus amylolyticus]|uniref:hypothetical protein n=1 Tax=Paenibacillus amylolyticus TaxID=1451 RepID=UPI000B897652|nr:hypothetical protein [Paenibacillus amylolyticus]
MTIEKPTAFRYAYERVTSKKKIQKFESSLLEILHYKRRYIDSITLIDNEVSYVNAEIKLTSVAKIIERKVLSEWIKTPPEELRKDDVFRIVDEGLIFSDYRGQEEFTAYSDSYIDPNYKDRMLIDYIYKEYDI